MEAIKGKNISAYIEQLGKYRIDIFKEYPYLYEGDLEYERSYLSRYAQSNGSILLISYDQKGIVGACTGIPLQDEEEEFIAPFKNEDITSIFYIGEIMVRSDSRSKGLGTALLSNIIELIALENYKKICLYTVQREQNHPLKPKNYISPDNLWMKFDFKKDLERLVYYHWRELNDNRETIKAMNVWSKQF